MKTVHQGAPGVRPGVYNAEGQSCCQTRNAAGRVSSTRCRIGIRQLQHTPQSRGKLELTTSGRRFQAALDGTSTIDTLYGPGTGFTSRDACMRDYKQCTLQTCVAEGAQDNCTWCASSPGCYNSDNAPCMANRSVTDSVECWLNPKCNTKKPYCNTHQVRPSRRCSLRVPANSRCRCGRASRVLGCPVGDAAP